MHPSMTRLPVQSSPGADSSVAVAERMAQPEPTLNDHLQRWLKGYQPAIAFCERLISCLHCWDDLIDKDQAVSDDTINATMWSLFIDLQQDSFYRANFSLINPIIQIGILNWHSANRLEQSTEREHRLMAFVLRSAITDVIAMCALIIGGPAWGRVVHYDMQISNRETFEQYCSTLPEVS